MASGWTNSGIDWTSVSTMRESRTEDIVRHLYLAVNERDFWIKNLSTGGLFFGSYTQPVLDRDGRLRTDQILFYIYSVFSHWFTDDPYSLSFSSFSYRFMYGVSCFPILSGIGNSPDNTVYNGLDYYNFSNNGNLEALTSRDFEWLRDWDSSQYSVRADLDILYTIYITLNKLNEIPCFISRVNINGESTQRLPSSNSTYVKNITEAYSADENNLDDAYDEYISVTPTNGTGFESRLNVDDGNNGYAIFHANLYIYLSGVVGYDNNNFEIDDFDPKNYILKDPNIGADTWERIETSVEPLGLSNEIFYPVQKSDFPTNYLDFNDYAFEPRVFLDINKEGFLNYYTEP